MSEYMRRDFKMNKKYDVIVAGGGPSGVVAAIAAARLNVRVLLIERYGFLGGNATIGLPLLGFHDASGKQIIKGIAQEFVDRLIDIGGSPGHVPVNAGHMATITPVDPEAVKLISQEMVLQEGADLLLHTWVSSVDVIDNNIKQLHIVNKSGPQILKGSIYIDATGDGDIAAEAGVPYSLGDENKQCQPMTLMFAMANVNIEKVSKYINKEICLNPNIEGNNKFARILHLAGDFGSWDKFINKEKLFSHNEHKMWIIPIQEGRVYINTIKVTKNSTNAAELTEAEITGRREAFRIANFLNRYIPGFEKAYISTTAHQIGIRESRRINGLYRLNKEDIIEGRKFYDAVVYNGYPVDMHDTNGQGSSFSYVKNKGFYQIPYRCLLPQKINNLIVTGRCISSTREAMSSARVMAPCMGLGQAAGVAAALSYKSQKRPSQINISNLKEVLKKQQAFLGE